LVEAILALKRRSAWSRPEAVPIPPTKVGTARNENIGVGAGAGTALGEVAGAVSTEGVELGGRSQGEAAILALWVGAASHFAAVAAVLFFCVYFQKRRGGRCCHWRCGRLEMQKAKAIRQ
jgi:hypothetical protein